MFGCRIHSRYGHWIGTWEQCGRTHRDANPGPAGAVSRWDSCWLIQRQDGRPPREVRATVSLSPSTEPLYQQRVRAPLILMHFRAAHLQARSLQSHSCARSCLPFFTSSRAPTAVCTNCSHCTHSRC
jgi:hypothetical protein